MKVAFVDSQKAEHGVQPVRQALHDTQAQIAPWLLARATVALLVPGSRDRPDTVGTGFFVAPGVDATCAHVLADRVETLPVEVGATQVATGRQLRLRPRPAWYFRDGAGTDLAFLAADEADSGDDQGLLSREVTVGDEVWVFGHPDGMFCGGQSATCTYQGDSRRGVNGGLRLPPIYGVPVGAGYSRQCGGESADRRGLRHGLHIG